MLFREFGAVNLQNFFEKCTEKALREYQALKLHSQAVPKLWNKRAGVRNPWTTGAFQGNGF